MSRSNKPDPYDGFTDERLRFWLCVIREIRHVFEAAAASKWITYLIFSTALGGSSSWLLKTYWLH